MYSSSLHCIAIPIESTVTTLYLYISTADVGEGSLTLSTRSAADINRMIEHRIAKPLPKATSHKALRVSNSLQPLVPDHTSPIHLSFPRSAKFHPPAIPSSRKLPANMSVNQWPPSPNKLQRMGNPNLSDHVLDSTGPNIPPSLPLSLHPVTQCWFSGDHWSCQHGQQNKSWSWTYSESMSLCVCVCVWMWCVLVVWHVCMCVCTCGISAYGQVVLCVGACDGVCVYVASLWTDKWCWCVYCVACVCICVYLQACGVKGVYVHAVCVCTQHVCVYAACVCVCVCCVWVCVCQCVVHLCTYVMYTL